MTLTPNTRVVTSLTADAAGCAELHELRIDDADMHTTTP